MTWLNKVHRGRYPLLALASLLLLLVAGVVVAVTSERTLKAELAQEAGAQADLLASAVSGALAFDDRAAAQEYVNAVQVNPNVLAAAVYDTDGRVVVSFARLGEAIPSIATPRGHTTVFQEGRLYVVRPVEESGQWLGSVRLRLLEMPASQRLGRYAGLLVVLGLAALAVVILAGAQSALRRANRELAERADELAHANALLHQQMVERQKAEEALRQGQKMEAIGQLTGGIAHDFNNLLMVASSGIDLLDRTNDPAKRKKLSDGVRQAVERGAALTRQLLAFSRRAPLKSEVLDPAVQIEAMRFLLERSLREAMQVDLALPKDLWRVEADPGEFELALLNLAVNARDAMPNGGSLTVSAHNAPADSLGADMVCITVTDTGVGMSEAVASRVFEPFFTTKEVGRGTGLGLSQVYGFVRSSGGEISVHSSEGQGATFTLCLPRTDKPLSEPRPSAPAQPEARKAGKAKGRILMVEDDDAVAAGVGHMLRDLGYTYVRAAQASDALAIAGADGPFDLVLSDMVMPGEMDGLGLAKTLRATTPDLPIVLMTGFSEAASAATAENFRLLLKPYRIDDLATALAESRNRASAS